MGFDMDEDRSKARQARTEKKAREAEAEEMEGLDLVVDLDSLVDTAREERRAELEAKLWEGVEAILADESLIRERVTILPEPSDHRPVPGERAVKDATRKIYADRQCYAIWNGLSTSTNFYNDDDHGRLVGAGEYAGATRQEPIDIANVVTAIALHTTNFCPIFTDTRAVEHERANPLGEASIVIRRNAEGSPQMAELEAVAEEIKADFPDILRRDRYIGMSVGVLGTALLIRLTELADEGRLEIVGCEHLTGVTTPGAWPEDRYPPSKPMAAARARLFAEMLKIEDSLAEQPMFDRKAYMVINSLGYRIADRENWPVIGKLIREVAIEEFRRSTVNPAGQREHPVSLEARRAALRADVDKAMEQFPEMHRQVVAAPAHR